MCCYIVSAVHTVPITVYPTVCIQDLLLTAQIFLYSSCVTQCLYVLHDKTLTKEVFKCHWARLNLQKNDLFHTSNVKSLLICFNWS